MVTRRKTLFKVVEKSSRKGTNYLISAKERVTPRSVYIKTCKKNALVETVKGSLGIFTFKTKRAAQSFIAYYNIRAESIIIKVAPIGRGMIPKGIAAGGCNSKSIKNFYLKNGNCLSIGPPKGTICYPAVTVIS